jgi:transcriptional regulator with XRE-family HTH domain
VAEQANVRPNTVSRLEQDDAGPRGPRDETIDALRRVYEAAGVQFIPENGGGAGVRLAKREAEGAPE